MHKPIIKYWTYTRLNTYFPLRTLSLLAALLTVGFSLWLEQQVWTQHSFLQLGWLSIAQYSLLAILMLIIWLSGSKTNSISDYKWLIIVAILARIILIPVESYNSNDIDRYIFDGKIAISGFDPYQISHDNDDLTTLREQWQPPEEHAKYTTLYPPLALALFSLAASAGIDFAILIWKTLVTAASIATLLLMIRVLQYYRCLRHLPLLALSPLLILETGVGGHVDIFSTLAISAALYFWTSKRLFYTGIALGLGTLCKVLPVVLLLPLVLSVTRFYPCALLVSGAVITIFTGYISAFLIGLQPLGSLPIFFEKWRNGSPLFDFIQHNVASDYLLPSLFGLAVIGFCLVAWVTWCKTRTYQEMSLNIRALQWTLSIPLLISPVVFPWYLMPLVPLFVLSPSSFLLLWFVLMPFTYEVLNQFACCQRWAPANWPITLLMAGMLLGLAIDWLKTPLSLIWKRTNAKTI